MNPVNPSVLVAVPYSNFAEPWRFLAALQELQTAYSESRFRKKDLRVAKGEPIFPINDANNAELHPGAYTSQWAADAQENAINNVAIPKVEALLSEDDKKHLKEPGKYILVKETINTSGPSTMAIETLYGLYIVNNRYKVESGSSLAVLNKLMALELAGTPYDSGMYINTKR